MNTISNKEINELTYLKFDLLLQGIRLTEKAIQNLDGFKNPIRTRSGASGGLDIVLPHDVFVNVPVSEHFVSASEYELGFDDGRFKILKQKKYLVDAFLLPEPKYYGLKTSDGSEDMVRIGQMCSPDRFCYGMTGPGCYFWASSKRCKFCSIGNNYNADAGKKRAEHLIEVLEYAINEEKYPAKHILIGGGTPATDDMGARLIVNPIVKTTN
jgi:hypothetical protein